MSDPTAFARDLCAWPLFRAERITWMRPRSSFSLSQYNGIPNEDNQNGANDENPFHLREHLIELIRLRDWHAQIPLNSCDLFKSFSGSLRPVSSSTRFFFLLNVPSARLRFSSEKVSGAPARSTLSCQQVVTALASYDKQATWRRLRIWCGRFQTRNYATRLLTKFVS